MNEQMKRKFDDFIDKTEIIYVILIAWGFAKVACAFSLEFGFDYLMGTIISSFVLMRFFFAPSHNLKTIAEATYDKPFSQRIVMIDLFILILHSFIYYRMCYWLTKVEYFTFYKYFYILLFVNVLWLVFISLRLFMFKSKRHIRFLIWSINNAIHLIIFGLLFLLHIKNCINILTTHLYLLFIVALSNCLFDFALTAPDYLGFRKVDN